MPRGNEAQGNRSEGILTDRRSYLRNIGIAASAGIAGCVGGGSNGSSGGTGGSSNQTVNFRMLASDDDPDTRDLYVEALNTFGDEKGYQMNVTPEFVSMGVFNQKMNTYVGSGNLPDLVYGGGDISSFSQEFEDIGDIMDANNVPSSVKIQFPGAGALLHPVALEPNSRWYRKDVWEDAGISKPADNWSQHLRDMENVSQNVRNNEYPSYYQVSSSPGSMQHMWYSYEVQKGLNYIERTGPKLDEVRVSLGDNRQAAIEFLEMAKKCYQYSPDTQGHSWGELITSYVESVSMQTLYPGRLVNNLLEQNPDLMSATRVALPELPDGQTHEEDFKFQLSVNGLAVPSDAPKSNIAKEFLRWFFNSKFYDQSILSVAPHTVPIDLSKLNEEPYKSNENWTRAQEVTGYKDFLQEWVPKAGYPKIMGRTDPVSPYWKQITYDSGIIPTMIQRVLLNDADPGSAVDRATQDLKQQTQQVVDQFTG